MPNSSNAVKQFRLAITSLTALVLAGTLGYHILEHWSLFDSFYMTVITLGTVGYREVGPMGVEGRVFTIFLIIFGLSIVFWAGASLIEAVVGEQMWHDIRRKKMQKHIAGLNHHYIICGFGRMGQQIVKDLHRENVPHVVIERNPEQMPKLVAGDIPFIEGNASDDKALKAAGIERAVGLITVAPSDEDNVFITLSARALNRNLFIVARSMQEENEDKLRMAGANRVMSPYVMGGKRMATAILRPNVVDFLELAMHTDELNMMIEEIPLEKGSCLAGKTISESGMRKQTGVNIIAIRKASGKMVANPSADVGLEEGDILIVLGVPDQLSQAEALTCAISD